MVGGGGAMSGGGGGIAVSSFDAIGNMTDWRERARVFVLGAIDTGRAVAGHARESGGEEPKYKQSMSANDDQYRTQSKHTFLGSIVRANNEHAWLVHKALAHTDLKRHQWCCLYWWR
jgi:hypothetical protein